MALLVFVSALVSGTRATAIDEPTCDAAADIALKDGDYSKAIELHFGVLRSERNNALAHYHLGFAYGMVGRVTEEIDEYRTAISLGLNPWDLFLNLRLAYYDRHELYNATSALQTAVSLGPDRAETHFNLAVLYERDNRLDEALHEIIVSLVLAPDNLDAVNTDAIICARMGNLVMARGIWMQLIQAAPYYARARDNLTILNRSCEGTCDSRSHRTELLSKFEREE
jgi:Flp pilus assembly protein TadD